MSLVRYCGIQSPRVRDPDCGDDHKHHKPDEGVDESMDRCQEWISEICGDVAGYN